MKKPAQQYVILEGKCAGPKVCPLSQIEAGSLVCIRELATSPAMTDRLRELGFREDQHIRLLTKQSNLICQVCNARLGISEKLADGILVEAVAEPTGIA